MYSFQDKIQEYWFKIENRYKIAFFSSIIIFYVTHICFFNENYFNEDYHHDWLSGGGRIVIGRWLSGINVGLVVPWVLGLVCAVLLAVVVVVVINIFDIKNIFIVILASGLMNTFPVLAYGNSYLFMVDIYAFSYFWSILAVWIIFKYKYGFLISGLFIMLSLANYQAQLSLVLGGIAFKFIYELLVNKRNSKDIICLILKCMIAVIIGVVAYILCTKFILSLKNINLLDYKGMSSIGKIEISDVSYLLERTYINFGKFFVGENFFYVSGLIKCIYIISFIIFVIFILKKVIENKLNKFKILLLLLSILSLPLCLNVIDFVAPETSSNNLTIYSFVLYFVFILSLMELCKDSFKNICITGISFLVIVVIICNNYFITSAYYLRVKNTYEQTMAFYNRMYSRIEETENFSPDMPIVVMEDATGKHYNYIDNSLNVIINDPGIRRGILGISEWKNREYIANGKINDFLRCALGVDVKTLKDQKQIDEIKQTEEYKNMGRYPDKDGIKIINGTVVVNFLYHFSLEYKSDKNKVQAYITGEENKDSNFTYSWTIFEDTGRKVASKESNIDREICFDTESGKTYYIVCKIYDLDNICVQRLETERFTSE